MNKKTYLVVCTLLTLSLSLSVWVSFLFTNSCNLSLGLLWSYLEKKETHLLV